jgi:hypothetical protein
MKPAADDELGNVVVRSQITGYLFLYFNFFQTVLKVQLQLFFIIIL